MARIAALNDWSLGSSEEEEAGPSREVLEAEAAKCYNDAVRHLAHGHLDQAQEHFLSVISNPYIEKACWPENVEPGGVLPQDLALKYSCLKNLGNLATKKGENQQAVEYFLEAVRLDHTEVTLWQRLGAAAIKVRDFELALVAFQEGLNINRKHWPCLDQLLSVLFILQMYTDCLGLIINALQRDPGYIKANAFKDKIFELQPSLIEDVKHLFHNSHILFKTVEYDKEQGKKFIATCESLRPPNKTPKPPSPLQCQLLRKPLNKLSWETLAQALIVTYDELIEADPMDFAASIDIIEALKQKDEKVTDDEEMEIETGKVPNADEEVQKLCNGVDGNKENGENPNGKKVSDEGGREEERISPVSKVTESSQSSPPRISSRRQTIELGESQDSFRVSEKRRSVDSDTYSRSEDELRLNDDGQEEESKKIDKTGEMKKGTEKLDMNSDHMEEGAHKESKEAMNAKIEHREINEDLKNKGTKEDLSIATKKASCESAGKEGGVTKSPLLKKQKYGDFQKEYERFKGEGRPQESLEDVCDIENDSKALNEKNTDDNQSLQGSESVLQKNENISMVTYQEKVDLDKQHTNKEEVNEKSQEEISINQIGNCDKNDGNTSELQKCNTMEKGNQSENQEERGMDLQNEPRDKETAAYTEGVQHEQVEGIGEEDEHLDRATLEEEGTEEPGEEEIDEATDNADMYHEEEGLEDEGEMHHEVTETEAAVNALKGIMALQPTEILGLPEPDFDYESEYVEYFDGGVYEEDELGQEGIEHEENLCEDEPMDHEGLDHEESHVVSDMQGDIDQEGMEHDEDEEAMEHEGLDQEGNEGDQLIQEENGDQGIEAGMDQDVGCEEEGIDPEDNREAQDLESERVVNEECDQDDVSHAEEDESQCDVEHEDIEHTEGIDQEGEGNDHQGEVNDQDEEGNDQVEEEVNPAEEEMEPQEEANEDLDGKEKMEETEEGEMEEEEEGGEEEPSTESQEEEMATDAENDKKEKKDVESENEKDQEKMIDTPVTENAENQDEQSKQKTDDKKDETTEKMQVYTTDENTASEAEKPTESQPQRSVSGRKPRRPKRGLERELEQLDYWGRRLERDAKRRRRTISSKLLGNVEEAEYLTWADLLRSFIPNSLLSQDMRRKTTEAQSNSSSSTNDAKFAVPSLEKAQSGKSVLPTDHITSSVSCPQLPSSVQNKVRELVTDGNSTPAKICDPAQSSNSDNTDKTEVSDAKVEYKTETPASKETKAGKEAVEISEDKSGAFRISDSGESKDINDKEKEADCENKDTNSKMSEYEDKKVTENESKKQSRDGEEKLCESGQKIIEVRDKKIEDRDKQIPENGDVNLFEDGAKDGNKKVPEDLDKLPEELAKKLSEDSDKKSPEELDRKLPEDLDKKLSDDLDKQLPEVLDKKLHENLDKKLPEDLDKKLPEDLDKKLPEDLDKKLPEDLDKKLPEDLDKKLPEDLDKKLPENLDKKLPEESDQKLPEALDRNLPENMEKKIPEDGSKVKENEDIQLSQDGDEKSGDRKKVKEEKEIEMEIDDNSLTAVRKSRKEKILSSSAEEEQVEAFLLYFEENGGILHLLQQFLRILMRRYQRKWPISAAKMFTEIYPRVRNHVYHVPALGLKEDCNQLHEDSLLSLIHWELMISLYQTSKLNTPVKDKSSLPNPFAKEPQHLQDDLLHLMLMLGRGDVWMEETPQFHTRLRWLQAQLLLCSGKSEEAAIHMELLLSDLERLSDDGGEFIVERTCVMDDHTVVCNSEVQRHLNLLQRSQMLEQVVDNYTDGRYRVVADLLTAIFHEPIPKARPGVTLPTRQTQLAILIDSLFKLNDHKGVITWGSHSLGEALKRFNRAEAEEEKNRWAKTLMKITECSYITVTKNVSIVEEVDPQNVIELVNTLTLMLVIQLERPQSAEDLPFETLLPWILLHKILSHEERRQENIKKEEEMKKKAEENATKELNKGTGSTEEKESIALMEVDVVSSETGHEQSTQLKANNGSKPSTSPSGLEEENNKNTIVDVVTEDKVQGTSEESTKTEEGSSNTKGPVGPYPSSLFLITAHDELGKHSWCCTDDGVFLLYCLDVLIDELNRPIEGQQRQLLHHALEQVSFCLYSHPSKKSKHKHLRDHGVPQIALCWERALQLYHYYVPKELPTFQSAQIPSITDDVAALFKRIIALLPDEDKPENQTEDVEAYIKGKSQECNFTPFKPSTDIIDCYYLLGDYYFKNKEWTNAIKYYKLDVSINIDRLDSWAPLGLAKKAMLETQLNSCEVIQDEENFFSLAQEAVQCLKQALNLDEYHTNLWVEFGGLVYMVHSHASRLLKQDLNPDISLETFEMLEKLKGDMLSEAERCFMQALKIQEEGWDDEGLPDERWLHCYMLGKISEKQGKPPKVILQRYIEAGKHLHQIQAKYPAKINYNSPQEYSVEALEMYYRGHAYMLKYLLQREGKPVDDDVIKYFMKVLDELAACPFAMRQEKKKTSEDELNKTVAEGDELEEAKDLTSTQLSVKEGEPKKRSLEGDDATDEPPTKRVQTGQESDEVRSVIKEVVDDIISDAAAKSSDTNKIEGEEEISGDKESKDTAEKENSEGKVSKSKETKESDDEILVVEEKVIEKKDHLTVISRCLAAMKLCLSRFPQHYKSLYRLAHYYHTSKFHKDSSRARNYLLGCEFWQRVGYMPVNGLFNERKVWIQQPKNSNLFHGIWRIPNDEVDRPGSFAAHMYRCVSITLDILPQMKDFFTILEIALALKNSPDKDKKYLRDNERELLSEHATQVGLQAMKDKYKILFKSTSPVHGNRRMAFLLDVYRSYKQISKHLQGSEPHLAKMLTEAYTSYRGLKSDGRANILREAESFCNRNQYFQHRVTVNTAVAQTGVATTNITGTPVISRRGRPPGTGRGRGRGRGSLYTTSRQSGDMLAVQQAYKIYESLIQAQTLLNNKNLDRAATYNYQKQLEHYQTQLLKYLHIPSVSQYFQSSLQGLGNAAAKLPPPSKGAEAAALAAAVRPATTGASRVQTSAAAGSQLYSSSKDRPPVQSQSGVSKTSLTALAARSHAHGISITSVSASKQSTPPGKLLKPNMSVTVSPAKTTCPPALQGRGDISVVSVSRSPTSGRTSTTTTTTTTSPKPSTVRTVTSVSASQVSPENRLASTSISKSVTTTTIGSVPKLPAGTTLTRPSETTPPKGSAPRPQLQAQARPVKNVSTVLDSLPGPMRKMAAEILSNSGTSVTRASVPPGSSQPRTSPDKASRPNITKQTTITPAPRIKSQGRVPLPQTKSPSSFLGAYQASLGVSGNKATGASRAPSSTHGDGSVVLEPARRAQGSQGGGRGRITQLSSSQLMQIAYGNAGRGGTVAGRGASSDNISELIREIAKNQQPVSGRPQAVTVQRAQGVTVQRPQTSQPRVQPVQASQAQQRPVPQPRPPQPRPPQPRPPQPIQKTSPPKPGQGGAGRGSDDIITLD